MTIPPDTTPGRALQEARRASTVWSTAPLEHRVTVIARFRRWLTRHIAEVTSCVDHSGRRSPAETLVTELAPLLEATRFLERDARHVLAPRHEGWRGRPLWLTDCQARVERRPWGVVLVLGPANYPLMLPAIQVLQALVAGNAVVLKPGDGGGKAAALLQRGLSECGLPPGCLGVLEASEYMGVEALNERFDHVVLTGSCATGQTVLARLAPRITPATVELSGHDASIVLPDADPDLVARELVFGATLNGGATCIAPRRVMVPEALRSVLESRLAALLAACAPVLLPPRTAERLEPLVQEARQAGARIVQGGWRGQPDEGRFSPMLMADVTPGMRAFESDLGAPVLLLVPYARIETAIALVNDARYRLGASVFGPEQDARRVADRLDVGTVVINDLIVPTADPRLPFGGVGRSGYGVTRGREGLLAMTRPRVTIVRSGRWRPHLQPLEPQHLPVIAALLGLAHGDALTRWRALCSLPAALRAIAAGASSRPGTTTT